MYRSRLACSCLTDPIRPFINWAHCSISSAPTQKQLNKNRNRQIVISDHLSDENVCIMQTQRLPLIVFFFFFYFILFIYFLEEKRYFDFDNLECIGTWAALPIRYRVFSDPAASIRVKKRVHLLAELATFPDVIATDIYD